MNWTKVNMPDMTGKIVIITGANTGIGFEVAKALSELGATVTLAGRDLDKLRQAAGEIQSDSQREVELGVINLDNFKSIHTFVEEFKSNHKRLDILVNNAGVMIPPASTTAEGFEFQFGVNFMGHYLLTGLLFPLLQASSAARIVTLSSLAAIRADNIDFENLRLEKTYDKWREYAVSKLANVVFASELQRRLEAKNEHILSLAAHPGVTSTNLQRHLPGEERTNLLSQFKEVMEPWQGALPALYAASEPKIQGFAFYGPDGEKGYAGYPGLFTQFTPAMTDLNLAKRLWEYAETQAKIQFP